MGENMNIEWSKEIEELEKVEDLDIQEEIKKLNISIDSDKFNFAFSGISIPESFANIDNNSIKKTLSIEIPDEGIEQVKSFGLFIIKPYIAFLYMRSETIEQRIDEIDNNSPLKPFADFFSRRREKTPGQHIRNALAHGTLKVNRESGKLDITDRNWSSSITLVELDQLCNQIKRFYINAYMALNS